MLEWDRINKYEGRSENLHGRKTWEIVKTEMTTNVFNWLAVARTSLLKLRKQLLQQMCSFVGRQLPSLFFLGKNVPNESWQI